MMNSSEVNVKRESDLSVTFTLHFSGFTLKAVSPGQLKQVPLKQVS